MARSLHLRTEPVGLAQKVRQVLFVQKTAQARKADGNGPNPRALAEHLKPGPVPGKIFFCMRQCCLCGGKVSGQGLLLQRLRCRTKFASRGQNRFRSMR